MAEPKAITYPEANLIDTKAMENAQVREIDFAEKFGESIKKLVEALGVTRKIPKSAGTVLKTYKATGELLSGAVGEGEIIPLSQYKVEPTSYKEITLNKWRKATSAEAIIEYGEDQAITMTTDRMLKDVQKGIRKNFFDFIKDEHGTTSVTGVGLQGALAKAWGNLQTLFEDDEISAVYFVNPMDIADYLGGAQISTQTAFGMTYIENFLGIGRVFMNTSVPKGKVYATAQDNIVMYYIPVNGADLGGTFSFTTDATGYIGIHETSDYTTLTAEDVVISGIELFAERVDGIVISTIGAIEPSVDGAE